MHLKLGIYTSLFLFALPALAANDYKSSLTNAEWHVTENIFECKITRDIARYGQIEIAQKAGGIPTLSLKTPLASNSTGIITIYREAAPWQPKHSGVSRTVLGTTPLLTGQTVGVLSAPLTREVLDTLQAGQMTTFELKRDTHVIEKVQLTTIGFEAAHEQFSRCLTNLLPVSYQQVREANLLFDPTSYELSEAAQTWLNHVIAYIKNPQADAPVKMIQLEGFTDNQGTYAENRLLSLKRVWAAKDYLVYHGVPAVMIRIRGMASRDPVGDNNTPEGRAQNHRVNIQLIQEPYDSPQYLFPQ